MKLKLITWIIGLLVFMSIVNAIGISPSRKEIYYTQGGQETITFRLLNNEFKTMSVHLVARGELSQYIKFEKETIELSSDEGEIFVNYKINMPNQLSPGPHSVEILAIESSPNSEDNLLIANIGVIQKLIVMVPYPNQYITGILYLSESRPNEEIVFTVAVSNVGSNNLQKVKGHIIITGPSKEGVGLIETNEISLKTEEKSKITGTWIANVKPGTYHVQAAIEYDGGKTLILENDFDIGEPLLEIVSVNVASFKLGTIAKFDIDVLNKWNQEIPEVYGITQVMDTNGVLIDTYKTGTVNIPPFENTELNSYWDTKDAVPGRYTISIKIHYLGRTFEKVFELDVGKNKIEIINPSITGEVINPFGKGSKFWSTLTIIIVVGIFVLVIMYMILGFLSKKKEKTTEDHPELRDYIRNKLNEGYSSKSIRKTLEDKGWKKDIIDYEMMRVEDEKIK